LRDLGTAPIGPGGLLADRAVGQLAEDISVPLGSMTNSSSGKVVSEGHQALGRLLLRKTLHCLIVAGPGDSLAVVRNDGLRSCNHSM